MTTDYSNEDFRHPSKLNLMMSLATATAQLDTLGLYSQSHIIHLHKTLVSFLELCMKQDYQEPKVDLPRPMDQRDFLV